MISVAVSHRANSGPVSPRILDGALANASEKDLPHDNHAGAEHSARHICVRAVGFRSRLHRVCDDWSRLGDRGGPESASGRRWGSRGGLRDWRHHRRAHPDRACRELESQASADRRHDRVYARQLLRGSVGQFAFLARGTFWSGVGARCLSRRRVQRGDAACRAGARGERRRGGLRRTDVGAGLWCAARHLARRHLELADSFHGGRYLRSDRRHRTPDADAQPPGWWRGLRCP